MMPAPHYVYWRIATSTYNGQLPAIISIYLICLSNGAIYALIGFGFAIIYNATGIINFAQGEFVMLGGMLTVFFLTALRLPLVPAIVLSILFRQLSVSLLNVSLSDLSRMRSRLAWLLYYRRQHFIRGAAMLIWGKDTHALPAFSGNDPLYLAGATILSQHLWIFAVTILIIIASRIFFNYSIVGKPCAPALIILRRQVWSVLMLIIWFCYPLLSARLRFDGRNNHCSADHDSYDVGIMLGWKALRCDYRRNEQRFGNRAGRTFAGLMESLGAGFISASYKDAIAYYFVVDTLCPAGRLIQEKGTERF